MDLRQVEYVVAIADEGTFTRAAAAVHVAQPSLSQGIRRLEAELGVALFRRVGRRAVLSSAGEAFLGPARQLLRDAAAVHDAVGAVRDRRAGTLDLVALPTLAADPLAPLVGAFRSVHPGVTVRITEPEDAAAVAALVRSGRCEVGLAELPVRDAEIVTAPLLDEEVVAVAPPGTALTRGARLPVARLASLPLVTTPPGTSTRLLVERACAEAGVEPLVAVETGQREAIVPLVLGGAGVAFLPRPLAETAARRGAVVAGLDPALVRAIGVVHRRAPLSPAARAFVELARESVPVRRAGRRRP